MEADVTVRDVMNREYVGVSESDTLVDTVELLLREGADTAVVLRGTEQVGVLTERDVLAVVVEGPDPEEATVGDAMSDNVPKVSPDATIDDATDMLSTQSAERLIVANGSEPVGIVTQRELLTARAHHNETRVGVESEPVTGATTPGTELESEQGTFQDQSICEACGTLTRDLTSFNGQLLCVDCRNM